MYVQTSNPIWSVMYFHMIDGFLMDFHIGYDLPIGFLILVEFLHDSLPQGIRDLFTYFMTFYMMTYGYSYLIGEWHNYEDNFVS